MRRADIRGASAGAFTPMSFQRSSPLCHQVLVLFGARRQVAGKYRHNAYDFPHSATSAGSATRGQTIQLHRFCHERLAEPGGMNDEPVGREKCWLVSYSN